MLGDVSSVSASVVVQETVVSVFCTPCDPPESCPAPSTSAVGPCPPGSRVIVPSQTKARTASADIVLPPDVTVTVASVAVVPGVGGAPPNVIVTISIEDDAVEVTSELEAAFAERYVDSLTAFYLARGTAVAPGDIQVTVSPAAPRGARRALLQDAAPGASLEAGVSLLFPFSEIDFDVIRDTGVEEATALLRESSAAGAADAPAPPEPFASGEEILPAVLLVAADVRERFDAARLAASSRFSVSADPAALGGRCAGGLFSVRVPCEEPVRLSDLGFASAGEGGALGAVLAAVSASAQGCPGDTSLPSVRASDTDVLVCSARGGAGAQLLVQAARSPSVVDAIVAGSMRLSSGGPGSSSDDRGGGGRGSAAGTQAAFDMGRGEQRYQGL